MAQIIQAEGSAPATPSTGFATAYVKTDGLWYSKDDAGNEYRLSFTFASGTFTPAFAGSGTAGTFTYDSGFTTGRYQRVGSLVYVWGRINITAISVAPVGTMRITGLPITSANAGNVLYSATLGFVSQLDYPAGALQMAAMVAPNTTRIELYYFVDNGAAVAYPAASFTNTATDIVFSAVYEA